jgi:WD40 repeat protein/serine/threonine protein kinase
MPVEDTNYSFGYYIQRRRKAMDLTRAELAARVQCSYETIKKIERDERRPSPQIAELIADALGMPEDERDLFFRVLRGERMVDDLPLPYQPLGFPGQVIRGYTFQEQIGQGGYGAVYRAWQPSVGREVAIKVILPQFTNRSDFIRRFEAEARTIAHLEHPHITPLYDFWRDPHGAFLVMRWMRGGNLRTRLEQGGPISLECAAGWIDQLSRGLAAAHGKGVVHGDLKPENMLFDDDGNIYLSDFGIARRVESSSPVSPSPYSLSPIYSSPEHLRKEPLSLHSDLYCLGVLFYEMLAGKPPFRHRSSESDISRLPLLRSLRGDLPPKIDDFMQRALAWDPQERFTDALSMAAALEAVAAGRTLFPVVTGMFQHPPTNPYKGLRAFEEADAEDFFGRDGFVQLLIDRLAVKGDSTSQEQPAQGRFLAVVGPSGSGKSSVVKAGLLPALRQGRLPGAENWFIVEMTPGSHPFEELEAALLRVAVNPPTSLLDQLVEDERGLLRAVKRILPADSQVELLLFIDQFEELFTLTEEPVIRQRFLDNLLEAVSAADSRLRLVLTLRADFYDQPLLYPGFAELVRLYTEVVLPLTTEELAEAIHRPSERLGVGFEEDLVPIILSEVAAQPGALPLMQYALTELFECRQNGILTYAAYQKTGGVLGALSRKAEELYSSLTPFQQEVARQLFLRLVTLGEGVEDTRRRVKISELESLLYDSSSYGADKTSSADQPAKVVLETFGKARLLSFDRQPHSHSPTIEIAHEALLREWKRLRKWLDEARTEVRLQRALNNAASDWSSANHDPSFLLHGARLAQFESWADETSLALNSQELDYLAASLSARDDQEKKEQKQREREARLERRSRQFLRALVIVLLLGMLVSFGMAGRARQAQFFAEEEALARAAAEAAAVAQEEIARLEASLAFARGLAHAANSNLTQDPELSIMLALQSLESRYTPSGEEALRNSLHSSRLKYVIHSPSGFRSLDYSPDGSHFATISRDGLVQVWDSQDGSQLLSRKFELSGDQITYSPEGDRLAIGFSDGTLLVLDASTAEPLLTLTGHNGWFNDIAFSPDGIYLASANSDDTIRVWDAHSGNSIYSFEAPAGQYQIANALVFIPGTSYLIISDNPGNNSIVDLDKGGEVLPIDKSIFPSIIISSRVITKDGSWLAAPSSFIGQTVGIWDLKAILEGRSEPLKVNLKGHTNSIENYDFSQDGRLLATGSEDTTIKVWNLETDGGEMLMTLSGHRGRVDNVRISPDSSTLASISHDNTLRIWDITPEGSREVLTLGKHVGQIRDLSYHPLLERLATASLDGKIRIWNVRTGELLHILDSHGRMVYSVAFSPDGKYIVSGGADFIIRVWEVDSGRLIMELTGHEDVEGINHNYQVGGAFPGVLAVAYSPDGSLIASTGEDSTLRLWDAHTGELLHVLPVHPSKNGGSTLAFSPDGTRIATGTDTHGPEGEGAGQSSLMVRETSSWKILFDINDLLIVIRGISFSPDGKLMAVSGDDGYLRVFDAFSGAELYSLTHASTVLNTAFSPDGNYLVAVGAELTTVWDLEQREKLMSLPGHTDWVSSAVFFSDGRRLVTAGSDGTVRIYTMDLDELKSIAAARLTRWFTQEECRQYLLSDDCPLRP